MNEARPASRPRPAAVRRPVVSSRPGRPPRRPAPAHPRGHLSVRARVKIETSHSCVGTSNSSKVSVAHTRCLALPRFDNISRHIPANQRANCRLSRGFPRPRPYLALPVAVPRSGKDPDQIKNNRFAVRALQGVCGDRRPRPQRDRRPRAGRRQPRRRAQARVRESPDPYDATMVAKAIEAAQHVRRRA